ncbi:MAG TPA: APC family permease [Solirubrobacteraceae bacterium]|nr:APC family permease [Solirubrobacteraceae bacterium]
MSDVPQSGAATAPASGGHLGERRLSTVHAIGQSLAIGPIFSAGLLSGLVASVAGFNTPASVLLGSLGALCLGYVISVYARRYHGAGAIYEYVVHGGHPDIGVFSAGLYAIGLLFLGGGGVFIAIGFLTQGFFTAHLSALDGISWWIWGAIGLAIATGFNHFGVRLAIRGVLALAALSAVPFVITAIVVILKGGADVNTLSVFDPAQTSWNSVFNGILFAVTLFIGFEIAASIGEETHDPARSIPRAVLGTIALSAAFYLLVTYAAAIGFGPGEGAQAWAASPSPIGEVAAKYVGSGMATIVDLVVILDSISVAIAFTVGASRIFFALARDGLLPRALASTTRLDTPLGGNLVVVAAGIAALIFGAATNYGAAAQLPDEIQAFSISAAAGSYLIEAIYVILALFALRLVWRHGREGAWWKVPVVVAGLATPILAYKGSLDPWPSYPNNRGIIFALVSLGIVAVWYAYLKVRHPERIRNAARHAIAHHGVPPMDETLEYEPTPSDSLLRPKEV